MSSDYDAQIMTPTGLVRMGYVVTSLSSTLSRLPFSCPPLLPSDQILNNFNIEADEWWVWGAVIYLVVIYLLLSVLLAVVLSKVRGNACCGVATPTLPRKFNPGLRAHHATRFAPTPSVVQRARRQRTPTRQRSASLTATARLAWCSLEPSPSPLTTATRQRSTCPLSLLRSPSGTWATRTTAVLCACVCGLVVNQNS